MHGYPGLELTVTTDKEEYYIRVDTVKISGNLTLNGSLVPDGLVALEVDNPASYSVIIRTLKTGTAPISGAAINITDLFLCSWQEPNKPRNNVSKGSSAYFNVTIKNVGNETLSPLITLNFYQSLYPFYLQTWSISPLYPDHRVSAIVPFSLPSWVKVGYVTVYTSVFNTYPRLGGHPYCEEKTSTFEVVSPSGGSSSQPPTPPAAQSSNGTYNFIFRIPMDAVDEGFTRGTYTAHVSAHYGQQQATNSTTFRAELAGDVDKDGYVGSFDVFMLAPAYGSVVGDPNYNPDCDFDDDGYIGSIDVFILAPNYGKSA